MVTLSRKAIIPLMSAILLLGPALAQVPMSALEQFEAVSHENKGCPENSDCDAEMGKLLDQWKALARRWQTSEAGRTLFPKEVVLVTRKRGWPSEFYARPGIRTTLAPALFSSSCGHHRSKNPTETLMRGLGFIKAVEGQHAVFTKGDTEFRLKLGEAVFLQAVVWHRPSGPPLTYYLPLDEKPLYLEGDALVALVESEDLYALLTVKTEGAWQIAAAPQEGLLQYHEAQEEVPCPKETAPIPTGFQRTFCKKITDHKGAAAGVVQLFWACQ